MSDKDKLSSGKHVMVTKFEQNGKNFLIAVAVLGFLLQGIRTWDLTFEDQPQKYKIIKHPDEFHPKETAILKLENTIDNTVKQTELLIKVIDKVGINQEEIMKVQIKIGQDLDQIKNQN